MKYECQVLLLTIFVLVRPLRVTNMKDKHNVYNVYLQSKMEMITGIFEWSDYHTISLHDNLNTMTSQSENQSKDDK